MARFARRYRSLCVLVISWVQGVSDLYPIDRICPPEGSQYLKNAARDEVAETEGHNR